MPVEILDDKGSLLRLRVQGTLSKAEFDRVIQSARTAIGREGAIRLLVTLDGFAGWERHKGWGDLSFMMEEGRHIEKIAIVGDENWRDDALAFTAAGLRPTLIEFFAPSRLSDAQRWLG